MCLFIGVMPNMAIGLFKSDVEGIANVYDKPAATEKLSEKGSDPLRRAKGQPPFRTQTLVQTVALGLEVEE
jgi:hypothetical protein